MRYLESHKPLSYLIRVDLLKEIQKASSPIKEQSSHGMFGLNRSTTSISMKLVEDTKYISLIDRIIVTVYPTPEITHARKKI